MAQNARRGGNGAKLLLHGRYLSEISRLDGHCDGTTQSQPWRKSIMYRLTFFDINIYELETKKWSNSLSHVITPLSTCRIGSSLTTMCVVNLNKAPVISKWETANTAPSTCSSRVPPKPPDILKLFPHLNFPLTQRPSITTCVLIYTLVYEDSPRMQKTKKFGKTCLFPFNSFPNDVQ